MRIALIGPTYPFRGGIAHHTTLLAKQLSLQHDLKFISFSRQYPRIIFPGKSDKDPSSKPLIYKEVEYLIDSINPFSLIRAGRAIVRFNADLVIIPWWVTFWSLHFRFVIFFVKKYSDAEIVILCHNVIEHEANYLKIIATRFVLSKADRLLTQSRVERDKVRALLGDSIPVKVAFHPTYADLKVSKISKAQAQQQLDISGTILLFFGFVRPYKGLDVLLNAMPEILSKANKKVTLLIAGEFWKDRGKYENLIHKLDIESSIKLYDQYATNEDIVFYFAAADLVVQPYKSVTGSGVCQLAYGLNRPVVATDIGVLSEVIEDGVNGRLIAPDNPEALAQAVLESIEPEQLELLSKNAKLTKEKFSWERFASMICNADD